MLLIRTRALAYYVSRMSVLICFLLLLFVIYEVLADDECFDQCSNAVIRELKQQIVAMNHHAMIQQTILENLTRTISNLTATFNQVLLERSHVVKQPGIVEDVVKTGLMAFVTFVTMAVCTLLGIDYVLFQLYADVVNARGGLRYGCIRWLFQRFTACLRRREPSRTDSAAELQPSAQGSGYASSGV